VLGLGLLLVIGLGAWAVVQVARVLVSNDTPAAQAEAHPAGRPSPAAGSDAPGAPPAASSAEARVILRSAPPPDVQVARAPNEGADLVNQFQLAVRHQTQGNDAEALKHYRAVLAADARNVQATNNVGLLYHGRGSTTEAVDYFRRAIALDPQYVRARSNLAVALMEAGDLVAARTEVRAALALEPRNADLIVNLALIERADRHRERALELLVRATGEQPTNALAHYNLALVYDEQGEVARAYDHYTRFLAFAGPEHAALASDVRRHLSMLATQPAPR
jgi:tetratricopeptide (TPR) repeat protein